MPAKLNTELLKERKNRLLAIMSDYNLKHSDIMRLIKVSYNKVKNWRHGSTFFTTSDEYYLLQMIKEHYPQYEAKVMSELKNFQI